MSRELEQWFSQQGRELEIQFCRSLEKCLYHAKIHGIHHETMDIGRLMFYFHKNLLRFEDDDE